MSYYVLGAVRGLPTAGLGAEIVENWLQVLDNVANTFCAGNPNGQMAAGAVPQWCLNTTDKSLWICLQSDFSGDPAGTTWTQVVFSNSLASTSSPGLVQLAQNSDVAAGTDTGLVITCAGAASFYAPLSSISGLAAEVSALSSEVSGLASPVVSATPNTTPQRDGSGVLFSEPGSTSTSVVVKSQLDSLSTTVAALGTAIGTPTTTPTAGDVPLYATGGLLNVNAANGNGQAVEYAQWLAANTNLTIVPISASTFTTTSTPSFYVCDTTSFIINGTLVSAASISGRPQLFYNTGSHNLVLTAAGSDLINGSATLTITPGNGARLESNGSGFVALTTGAGGGGGSGTVISSSKGQLAFYASTGNQVQGQTYITTTSGGGGLALGLQSVAAGGITLAGVNSGLDGILQLAGGASSTAQASILVQGGTGATAGGVITVAGSVARGLKGQVFIQASNSASGRVGITDTNANLTSITASSSSDVNVVLPGVNTTMPAAQPGGSNYFLTSDTSGNWGWSIPAGSTGNGNLRSAYIQSSARQLPTSESIFGTYWHSGNWTQTGTINAAHNTRIYVNGTMTFVSPFQLIVGNSFGLSAGTSLTSMAGAQGQGLGAASPGPIFAASVAGGGGGACGGLGGSGGSDTAGMFNYGGLPYGWLDQFSGSSGQAGNVTNSASTSGDGGRAAGAIYIECTGALTVSGTAYTAITAYNPPLSGSNDGGSGSGTSGFGSGGGGSGGIVVIRCGSTVNLGTSTSAILCKGGAGGTGLSSSGAGGGGGGGIIDIVAGGTITHSMTAAQACPGGLAGTGSTVQVAGAGGIGLLMILASTTPVSPW